MSTRRLENKVAIIVGAGQQPGESIGNGRATAERFAQEGASLLLVDINPDWLADTLAAVQAYGHPVASLVADITDEAACQSIMTTCVEQFGRIDILHNNVGASKGDRKTAELPMQTWDQIMGMNLRGMFMTCKHALPHMIRQR